LSSVQKLNHMHSFWSKTDYT